MSHYLIDEIDGAPNIEVRYRDARSSAAGATARLDHLVLRDRDAGTDETVDADALFVLIGARPHTDWLPDAVARDARGYVLTGLDLVRERPERGRSSAPPLPFETSVPGVFAVGDVRAGSGQARRVGRRRGLGRDPAGPPAPRRASVTVLV